MKRTSQHIFPRIAVPIIALLALAVVGEPVADSHTLIPGAPEIAVNSEPRDELVDVETAITPEQERANRAVRLRWGLTSPVIPLEFGGTVRS